MKQEIELKEGMTARVEGGKLVIEMPEKYTPKKGEFVTCDRNTQGNKWIMIWGGVSSSGLFTSEAVAYNERLGLVEGCSCRIDDNFRPSTPEEIDILLSAMRKQGKQWDAKQMKVVDLKWDPKDGDIIMSGDDTISILGSIHSDGYADVICRLFENGHLNASPYGTYSRNFVKRPSTPAEIQQLLSALEKDGKAWNADKKRIEELRWRPKKGEGYYVAETAANRYVFRNVWTDDAIDKLRFDRGLVFRTESEAVECAKKMLKAIQK